MNNKRPKLISFFGYLSIADGFVNLFLCIILPLLFGEIAKIYSLPENITKLIWISLFILLPFLLGYGLLNGMKWAWSGEIVLMFYFIFICLFELLCNIGFAKQFNIAPDEIDMGIVESILGAFLALFIYLCLTRTTIKRFFKIGLKTV